MSYFSAHNHTEYSNLRLLDCTNKLTDLIDKAVNMGLKGIAITDHESLSGHIKAMNYVKEGKEKGKIPEDFVLACGNEVYLVDDEILNPENYVSGQTKYYHFILIAKDKKGHELLRKLSTQAWKNRYRTGKMERVPIGKKQMVEIIGKDKGHLIACSACLGGYLAECILTNNQKGAREFIQWCQDLFGKEDFYLEMQPNIGDEQVKVNKALVSIGKNLDIKWIITTDTHYLSKELAPIHAAYLRSRESGDREVETFYESCYLMEEDEIYERMSYFDKEVIEYGLNSTLEIAGKVETYDLYHDQVVPKVVCPEFEIKGLFSKWYEGYPYIAKFVNSSDIHDRYFLYLIEEGYKEKVGDFDDEDRIKRINDELGAVWESSEKIHDKISNYFITYLKIKEIVWDDNGGNSLIGPGRGSVGAMYTGYLCDIQEADAYTLQIPWQRFIHQSRPELPDIDFDTMTSRREIILKSIKDYFGEDKVLNICTFKTEGPRSALATAARGLGIPIEDSESLSQMIPVKRGVVTSLKVMVYGKEDDGIKPDKQFINACNALSSKLLEYALALEGMISGRSVHASGVIIFDEPYVMQNSMMTAPNGQPVTAFEANDSTYIGGLKYDFLTVTSIDTENTCMKLLIDDNYIEWQGSLKATYDKYLAARVLDYDSIDMWKMAWEGKIPDLFQMSTEVGAVAIRKIKPTSLLELGLVNTLERLTAQDGDTEQPIDKYVRYKNNEQEWVDCMNEYGLTEEEQSVIHKYLDRAHGISTTQEDVMFMAMDEKIAGFTVAESNKLRKSISKKSIRLQEEAKKKFYEKGYALGTRKNMLDYVWNEDIRPQLSYSFNLAHCLNYSIIAIQQMNLAYHYPSIYWSTACLITNSGADEEVEGNTTDYEAVGIAIRNLQDQGVAIAHPDINSSQYSFKPDVEKNEIQYALKAISGVGDDLSKRIVNLRPYTSYKDFVDRVQPTPMELCTLIKCGAFTNLLNQRPIVTMQRFLDANTTYVEKLTLAQINRLVEFGLINEDCKMYLNYRMINFKKYVLNDKRFYKYVIDDNKKLPKVGYNDRLFRLDNVSQPFFAEHFTEDSIVSTDGEFYVISEKAFEKEVKKTYIEPLIEWLNSDDMIGMYNTALRNETYKHYVKCPESHWSFDTLNFYDKHELSVVNDSDYGIVNFFNQPEDPEAYDYYFRYGKNRQQIPMPKYVINRISGTVLGKNKDKHILVLLTEFGVVKVKFNKGQFIHYSQRATGSKSWFERGTLLLIAGFRDGDIWRAKTYNDSIYKHTVNKIIEITNDNRLVVLDERVFDDGEE